MAVTRNDIIKALRQPSDATGQTLIGISDWRRITAQYPYCEILLWHYLRALYQADDVSFDDELQRLGIRLSDKQGFYLFMTHRQSSLFSFQPATTDYFAATEKESLSLTDLARRLRSTRLSEQTPFCTPSNQKNDISPTQNPPSATAHNPSEPPSEASGNPQDPSTDVATNQTDIPQNPNSLQLIRTQVSSLISQKKYSEALEILRRENFANSKKNAYFAVQIKYLETIINNK